MTSAFGAFSPHTAPGIHKRAEIRTHAKKGKIQKRG
jgi:hypothetical protein